MKFKLPCQGPDIIEILHTAVANAQCRHRLKFLSHDSFLQVSEEPRSRELQQCRICRCQWFRSDCVTKPDVNLQSQSGILKATFNSQTNPPILRALFAPLTQPRSEVWPERTTALLLTFASVQRAEKGLNSTPVF